MRFRLLSRETCIRLAVLACGGIVAWSAQAGERERGRKIEFSAPKSDEVTTNLHQLTSKKDSLKQLEEDLYKPLESFAPKSSLDGVPVRPARPPTRSVIENKRVKDLLERRKNWVFMNPDELVNVPTIEDVLKAPRFGSEADNSQEVAPMQGFYQRLSNKRSGTDPSLPMRSQELFGTAGKPAGDEAATGRDESSLPSGLKESADKLKRLFEPSGSDDPFNRLSARGTLDDTFGLALKEPSDAETKAHKQFLTDFRSLVDPTWAPPPPVTPDNPFGALAPTGPVPAAKPAINLPTVGVTPVRTTMDAQADIIAPRLGPAPLPDVNAEALGQPRSVDLFPKIANTRVITPPPSFEVPKRSFR